MCIAGLFSQPKPKRRPPPPAPAPEPIKPPPPPEVLKKEPASIAPASAPTNKKRKGLGIEDQAGQAESPASSGVPLGIGANSGNTIINTGV